MTPNGAAAIHASRSARVCGARLGWRVPYFLRIAWLLMWCPLLSMPTAAQVALPAPRAAGDSAASCVDVAINEHARLSYDCLNRRWMTARVEPSRPGIDLDPVVHEPSNRQLGQTNFSSLSHRMGANLGHSVVPQRPPAPPPAALSASFGIH